MSEQLKRLIGVIDAKLAVLDAALGRRSAFAAASYEAYADYRRRENDGLQVLLQQLQTEEGCQVSISPHQDYAIRLAGLRSSSMTGWRGALGNWKAAARKRLVSEPAQ